MIPLQVHALQAKEFPNEVATVTAPLCLACPAGKLLPIWDAGNLLERCDCWSAGCIRIHLAFGMFDFKGVGGTWRSWGWNTTSLVQILLFTRFLPFPRISSSQTQGPTFTSLFPCLSCLVQNLEYTYYIILHINIIIGLDLHSSLRDPALMCHVWVLMIPWTYSKDLQGLDGSSPRASAFTAVYITKLCSYVLTFVIPCC